MSLNIGVIKMQNCNFSRFLCDESSSPLGKTVLWAMAFLKKFFQTSSAFHFFGFRDNNFFTEQGLASSSQPGGPGPCVSVPQ
jgi:hypothetical protein